MASLHYSLLHDSCIGRWLVRFSWMCTIVFTAVYIGFSSKKATKPALAKDGGLSACFHCGMSFSDFFLMTTSGVLIFAAIAVQETDGTITSFYLSLDIAYWALKLSYS